LGDATCSSRTLPSGCPSLKLTRTWLTTIGAKKLKCVCAPL